jgi:hypothetical protein
MDTYELEVTTADTLPLEQAFIEHEQKVEQPVAATESLPREETMETETRDDSPSDSDVLLDLGEFEPVHASADDDFVLDLDDQPGEVPPAWTAAAPVRTSFVEPDVKEAVASATSLEAAHAAARAYQPQVHSSFADTQEVPFASVMPDLAVVEPEPVVAEPEPVVAPVAASFTPGQLTPEMIDVIARRVVEMMSDKVVREIAWEVVPELAELLVKQKLEEEKSSRQ